MFLIYLPEATETYLERVDKETLRVRMGQLAKALRIRNNQLWEAMAWLQMNGLVEDITKTNKTFIWEVKVTVPEQFK